MNRETRKVLVNAASNAVYFLSTVIVVFFVSPLLVHGLGDRRYGAWLLVNSVLAYMSLAELGVGASVVRYVSRYDGLGERESINRIFNTSLFIFAGIGSILLLVTLGIAIFWEHPFGVADEVAEEMRWLLAVLGANLAIALPMGIYKTVLIGLGRYPAVNAIRISALLLRNALFVLLIHFGCGLRELGLAITAGSLLDYTCSILTVFHYLPSLRVSLRYVDRCTFRHIRGYSAFIFLTYLASRLVTESNPLIVGAFFAPTSVTYFGIASGLSNQAGDGLRTAIAVLNPAVSKWDALGETNSIAHLLVTGTKWLLFVSVPIHIGAILMGYQFIAIWMGMGYADQCYPTLLILVIVLPISLAQAVSARILEGVGKVGPLFLLTLLQGVLTVVLGIALIGQLGVKGVAWGVTIAAVVQSVGVIVIACKVAGVPVSTYVARAWVAPAIAAGYLAGIWLLAISVLPTISSWPALFATGVGGLVLYLPMVLCIDSNLRRLAIRVLSELRNWLRPSARKRAVVSTSHDLHV